MVKSGLDPMGFRVESERMPSVEPTRAPSWREFAARLSAKNATLPANLSRLTVIFFSEILFACYPPLVSPRNKRAKSEEQPSSTERCRGPS